MRKPSALRKNILKFLESVSKALSDNLRSAQAMRRQAVLAYFEPDFSKRKVSHMISRLKYEGFIRVEHDKIELTPKGIERVRFNDMAAIQLDKPEQWDGIWRVIIWDIPERNRIKRDQARMVLRNLSFVRIQRSIWVSPYPCRDEINHLRSVLEIHTGLLYMEASYIEDQAKLRRHFTLQAP